MHHIKFFCLQASINLTSRLKSLSAYGKNEKHSVTLHGKSILYSFPFPCVLYRKQFSHRSLIIKTAKFVPRTHTITWNYSLKGAADGFYWAQNAYTASKKCVSLKSGLVVVQRVQYKLGVTVRWCMSATYAVPNWLCYASLGHRQ